MATIIKKKVVTSVKVSKKASSKKGKADKSSKIHPRKGVTTGLRFKQCWAQVFADNLKSPAAKRMTDEKIHAFMRKEFPLKKARTLRDVSGVAVARRRYNKGRFTQGDVPSVPSVEYDKTGKAVDAKSKKKGGEGDDGRHRGFSSKAGRRKSRSVRK